MSAQSANQRLRQRWRALGISVGGIRDFVAAHGGRSALALKTTTQVNIECVKPATAATRASYCQQLESAGSPHVSDATAFVSHAWGFLFMYVVDALEAWESRRIAAGGSGATFFWFDIFTNPQHGAVDRPFEWWNTTFSESVARIGQTLLVLEWDDPKPLTRAWCLVEIVATLSARASFDIVMAPEEATRFRRALERNFDSLVYKTCNIDLAKATAFHGGECLLPAASAAGARTCKDVSSGAIAACPNDLKRILDATAAGVGFPESNARVIERLRVWMVSTGRAALAALAPEERGASLLLHSVGRLLLEQGELDEAELVLSEALGASRRARGDDHPATLAALGNMAALLKAQGRLRASEALLREACAASQRVLGDAHDATLAHLGNLAHLLQALNCTAEAEAISRAVLAARRAAAPSGDERPETLTAIANLALLLKAQGRLDESMALQREALATSRRVLGDTHPDTLVAIGNMAQALRAQGDFAAAEALAREDLEGSRRTLGDAHPSTLIAVGNLASLLHAQGRLGDAEPLYRQSLEGRMRALGPHHPSTHISAGNLASLLKAQGSYEEAEPLYRAAVEGMRRTLGDDHPQTLLYANNLEKLLEARCHAAPSPGSGR